MIERLGVHHWFDWVLLAFGLLGVAAVGIAFIFGIIKLIQMSEEE